MKKFLSLMLVLICMVSMVACSAGGTTNGDPTPTPPTPPAEQPNETPEPQDVLSVAAKDIAPTTIVSLTTYTGKDYFGDDFMLSGAFTQVANGNNSILDFKYDRFATIEEAADSHIVTVEGAIAVRDGQTKTLGDSMDWTAVIPSLQQMGALKLNKDTLPADYTLSSDEKVLTVSLTQEEALAVIGVVIEAQGEITLTAESNGKNLSGVVISYVAASGANVRIATSYTYGTQTLDFSRFN